MSKQDLPSSHQEPPAHEQAEMKLAYRSLGLNKEQFDKLKEQAVSLQTA